MPNKDTAVLMYLIIWLIFTVGVFLIFREIICWYWKLNEIVRLLTEIRNNVRYNRAA